MPIRLLALFALVITAAVPARAADNLIERLATCQDSWLDAKDDPARGKALGDAFKSGFKAEGDRGAFKPTTKVLVAGLPVTESYPESVGMGVGFSVTLGATFDSAKAAVEKTLGKTLTHCETGDGMRMCDLEIAEKRTLMLMAAVSGNTKQTLLGCYYFYRQ